jgi:ferredoxin--NADP+ reductase
VYKRQGERIPLTIADFDREEGTITLVIQEVGISTIQMGLLNVGEGFTNIAGPLGVPSEIENYGKVIVVGGGVGIAPLFPITRALKQAGNHVTSIIGARNESLLFWEDRMAEFSDELIITTDDGSCGRKGLVTAPLKEILEEQKDISRVWTIGPTIMMKFVSSVTKAFETPTIASLNTIMIDGTGMCGGCRVNIGGDTRFVCVDGPEFDAHLVDWDSLISRMSFYHDQERESLQFWKDHDCKLEQKINAQEKAIIWERR